VLAAACSTNEATGAESATTTRCEALTSVGGSAAVVLTLLSGTGRMGGRIWSADAAYSVVIIHVAMIAGDAAGTPGLTGAAAPFEW
jgi:hypothetical protein